MGGPLAQGCLQPVVVGFIEIRQNVDESQVWVLRGIGPGSGTRAARDGSALVDISEAA